MNKITLKVIGLVVVVGMTLTAGQALGAYLIDWQDGTAENPFADWSGDGLGAERDTVAGDGVVEATINPNEDGAGLGDIVGGDTALRVDPSDQGQYEFETDYFYTTDSDLTGDLSEDYAGIRFDFYADTAAPTKMGAYFYDEGDDNYWFYEVDDTQVTFTPDTWVTYDFSFTSDNWTSYPKLSYIGGDGGAPTVGDLDDVTQIGFSVTYLPDNTTQFYGVDDFGLTVPEPETYLVLGMALLSVVIVFRKRITESLAEARTIMHL